jgi:hypothetical protein
LLKAVARSPPHSYKIFVERSIFSQPLRMIQQRALSEAKGHPAL